MRGEGLPVGCRDERLGVQFSITAGWRFPGNGNANQMQSIKCSFAECRVTGVAHGVKKESHPITLFKVGIGASGSLLLSDATLGSGRWMLRQSLMKGCGRPPVKLTAFLIR